MFRHITDEIFEAIKQIKLINPGRYGKKYLSKMEQNIIFCLKDCKINGIEKVNQEKIILDISFNSLLGLKLMERIHNQTLISVYDKYHEWFDKSINISKLLENNINRLNCSNNECNIKIDFDIVDRKIITKIFDSNSKQISYKNIQSLNEPHCDIFIVFDGVLFSKNNFSPSFKVSQIKLNTL